MVGGTPYENRPADVIDSDIFKMVVGFYFFEGLCILAEMAVSFGRAHHNIIHNRCGNRLKLFENQGEAVGHRNQFHLFGEIINHKSAVVPFLDTLQELLPFFCRIDFLVLRSQFHWASL